MLRCTFSLLFLIAALGTFGQSSVSVQQEAIQLKKKLLEYHVSPRRIDDQFSADVYNRFINSLDPDKLYFSQQDLNDLKPFETKLDDELDGISWNFLGHVTRKFKENLERSEKIVIKHTAEPFDFGKDEIYRSDTIPALDASENETRWRIHLKFETLNELIRLRASMASVSDKEFLAKKEGEARQRARKSSLRMISRILHHPTGYENYMESLFLRSIGLAFDPHNTHFSFTEMEDYMTSLSTEGYYFGITIAENERGEIIVDELTPGGPAWKSGKVHSGDVIEQVRWGGNAWIEVRDMSKDEMNELLLDSHQTVMEFMLVRAGGIQNTVLLKKEKMDADENAVKSFLLQGDQRKIGYISLPGFYGAWGDKESARCANDVAKEILKLRKENIDGLILDVRFNRGGSLYEAVAMAGIFIDAGPMGLLRDQSEAVASVKDMNRGTVYDGPLVLMVNGLSASASEFLAAALQDYNRAIIVGGKTYGKATGQRILPMQPGKNEIDSSLDMKSGWGFSTITAMKIYRVTGKTAQKTGVIPDILLPDIYSNLKFGEAYATGALAPDSVVKKTYYSPLKSLPLAELRQKSKERVARSSAFDLTLKYSEEVVKSKERLDTIPLNWTKYNTLVEREAEVFKVLREVEDQGTSAFTVAAHSFEKQRMQVDEFVRQRNEGWMKNLMRDISLEEAFFIICDYIAVSSAN